MNAHYFLIQALAKAGLTLGDIEVVYLAPADARAALENGDVAAWSIWDYFYAAVELQLGTRMLSNGDGIFQAHDERYHHAEEFMQTDVVVLAILIYALLGKLADAAVHFLEWRILQWHPGFKRH